MKYFHIKIVNADMSMMSNISTSKNIQPRHEHIEMYIECS